MVVNGELSRECGEALQNAREGRGLKPAAVEAVFGLARDVLYEWELHGVPLAIVPIVERWISDETAPAPAERAACARAAKQMAEGFFVIEDWLPKLPSIVRRRGVKLKADVEEVAQDILLRIAEYHCRRLVPREVASNTVKWACSDFFRRAKRRNLTAAAVPEENDSEELDLVKFERLARSGDESAVVRAQIRQHWYLVERWFKGLSSQQQRVFMRVLKGQKPREIANELGLTAAQVSDCLHKARKRLKEDPPYAPLREALLPLLVLLASTLCATGSLWKADDPHAGNHLTGHGLRISTRSPNPAKPDEEDVPEPPGVQLQTASPPLMMDADVASLPEPLSTVSTSDSTSSDPAPPPPAGPKPVSVWGSGVPGATGEFPGLTGVGVAKPVKGPSGSLPLPGSGTPLTGAGPAADAPSTTGVVPGASEAIAAARGGFRACYQHANREDGSPAQGSARMIATIGPNGDVVSVQPSDVTGFSARVVECLKAEMQSMHFKPPAGGTARLVIPVSHRSQ